MSTEAVMTMFPKERLLQQLLWLFKRVNGANWQFVSFFPPPTPTVRALLWWGDNSHKHFRA